MLFYIFPAMIRILPSLRCTNYFIGQIKRLERGGSFIKSKLVLILTTLAALCTAVADTDTAPVINSLTPDKTSPQELGTIVTWTANASDPDGDPMLFRFFLNDEPMTDWVKDNAWNWITIDANVGSNRIEVQVRDGKHAGPSGADVVKSTEFILKTHPSKLPEEPKIQQSPVSKAASVPHTEPHAPQVKFPDPNLEATIRAAINRPEGTIYPEDLEQLKRLEAKEKSIKDITGLEYCCNLENINLYRNQIINISPLSGLVNLKSLDLTDNQITDATPLSELTKLEALYLDENKIIDISPLTRLTNLKDLGLFHNRVVNVTPLSELTNLKKLSLRYNRIYDVSPLAKLTNLEYLYLENNPITKAAPLSRLKKLKVLLT
jgi:Leucine-rich repeat (LRR) protein